VNVLMALIMTAQMSGVWKKDPARSDDAREKMQEAFQQMRGEGGGGGGGGGGMHGGGGGMHGGGGGMHGGGMHVGGGHGQGQGQGGRGSEGGPMSMGITAPDELTLELEGDVLHVVDGTRTRVYTLDGEKHESETPNGDKLETTAQQSGNAVSIEEKMSRRRIDRKFEVSPDGQTLIVTSTVGLGSMREPVVIKSVYVRSEAAS
jgi:hypothetical protein